MSDRPERDSTQAADVDRRALLRRGGAIVAATVTGAAAVAAPGAGEAQAAVGDPVIQGQSNDSAGSRTALTSAASTSTLEVANTGGHAPVQLAAQAYASFTPAAGGELENLDGDLYYTFDFGPGAGPAPGLVYTEHTANQVVTITPQRIVDTRNIAGQAHIINKTGNLDSAGRLLGGHTISIDLSGLEFAATSAFYNLTVVSPLSGGFMTLFPGGTRPATSSINFVKSVTLANFAVTGTSTTDTVSIYSSATSHLLLDLTALNVGSLNQINPTVLSLPTSQRLAARAQTGPLPCWYAERAGR